jgi:transcriptional regulator with XRE-family HTH domain
MRNKLLAQKLGHIVRKLRQQKGWSQEEFADYCKLHRTYIGLIERGERAITIETASKLAHTLNISLSQILAQIESLTDVNKEELS